MKTGIRFGLLVGASLLMVAAPVWGQSASFKGYMFGDGYWMAANDMEEIENENGLWFRRIYLTFDFKMSETWSARVRAEMNSPGDFTTRARLEPFAKNAYVRWQKDLHQIDIGLSGTPTWSVVESVWGYRSVEKTLLDLQRLGSSADIGVSASGSFDTSRKVRYNVMVANGSSTRSETNEGKKAMLSLGFYPAAGLILEAYGDVDDRPGNTNRYTLQGFLGYQKEGGRLGVQYVYQKREMEEGDDLELTGLSLFGAVKLSEKVDGFARFDRMFDPNPEGDRIPYLPFDPTANSNLLLFGIDIHPHELIHFMPNAEVIFYDEVDGQTPGTTVMPRLTFYIVFS